MGEQKPATSLTILEDADSPDKSLKNESKVTGGVTNFDRWIARMLLVITGRPPVSIVLWNGEFITLNEAAGQSRLYINDRTALLLLLINPEKNFGHLYSESRIDVKTGLPAFLSHVYRTLDNIEPKSHLLRFLKSCTQGRASANTTWAARRNICHHYDLGNDFYEKWLDTSMQYTCAYFPLPDMSLEAAQTAKMHHICRKLSLQAGQSVVEAGCGWGGLSRFMVNEYGVRVTAYNISHEQVIYADQRAREQGLDGDIDYIEDDYRNITGDYDIFVSVGMLEHIGVTHYDRLGNVINRSLKEKGLGLIHSIGRNQPIALNPWIESRIFPGACPPCISQMMNIFEPWSFSVLDIENLRLHYAKTLEHWSSRFESNTAFFNRNFDEAFIRTWRLYLAGSIAAFTTGSMQLFQVLFSRSDNNDIPPSRAHLYHDAHP